ncbi:MAG: hypothetical protein HY725_19840 [Candidatus Rokubacteria bacterium]|nr:hypothetical protein [Candidatus Rokubacteria bacterium]
MVENASKSKRRSDASSKSRLPSTLSFFLDRSLGKKKIATALRQAGVQVEIHDDHFPQDARDEDWLQEAGRRGWIVLTKDRRIRHRALELSAVVRAGVRVFVLTAGDLQGGEMAEIFVKALPAMNGFAAQHSPPFIARVSRTGSVSMLFK